MIFFYPLCVINLVDLRTRVHSLSHEAFGGFSFHHIAASVHVESKRSSTKKHTTNTLTSDTEAREGSRADWSVSAPTRMTSRRETRGPRHPELT